MYKAPYMYCATGKYDYTTGIFCAICGEELSEHEYYITNEDGEHAHTTCLDDVDAVLDFLGVEPECAFIDYREDSDGDF